MDSDLRELRRAYERSPNDPEAAERFVVAAQRAGAPATPWLERVVRLRRLIQFPAVAFATYDMGVSIFEIANLLLEEDHRAADQIIVPLQVHHPLPGLPWHEVPNQIVPSQPANYCSFCGNYYTSMHTCAGGAFYTVNTAEGMVTDGPHAG